MVSLPTIFDRLMKTFIDTSTNIKQICEIILSNIWQVLHNFLDKNDQKINLKTGCQRNRAGFQFSINIPDLNSH